MNQCRLVSDNRIKDKKNFRHQIDRLDCEYEENRSEYLSLSHHLSHSLASSSLNLTTLEGEYFLLGMVAVLIDVS